MKTSFKLIVFVTLSLCLLQCKSPSNETEKSSSKKDSALSVCDESEWWYGNIVKPKGPVRKVVLEQYSIGSEWMEEHRTYGYFRMYEPTLVSFFDSSGNLTLRKTIDKKSGEEIWFEEYEYDDNGLFISYRKAGPNSNDTTTVDTAKIKRDKYGKRITLIRPWAAPSIGTYTSKYYYEGCNVVKQENFFVKDNKDIQPESTSIFKYDSLGMLRKLYEGETLVQTYDYDDQGNIIITILDYNDTAVNIYSKLGDPLSLESSDEYGRRLVTFTYSGNDRYGNWTYKKDSDARGMEWNRTIEYYE